MKKIEMLILTKISGVHLMLISAANSPCVESKVVVDSPTDPSGQIQQFVQSSCYSQKLTLGISVYTEMHYAKCVFYKCYLLF